MKPSRAPAKTNITMSQLANQIAVITGAGRGIGRGIALKFAAEGADIVCVSRTAENSEKAAEEVRGEDGLVARDLRVGLHQADLVEALGRGDGRERSEKALEHARVDRRRRVDHGDEAAG